MGAIGQIAFYIFGICLVIIQKVKIIENNIIISIFAIQMAKET